MARAIVMSEKLNIPALLPSAKPALRLGYVPLADCAPIVMAQELGLFAKHGLRVSLSREIGWAAVRDKIAQGQLEASQAVCGLPFAATLGLGGRPVSCVTGLVLNLQGNAITLSNELWKRGVRDAATLREAIAKLRRTRTFVFGVVSLYSAHHFLLRRWLKSGGIDPDRDVRLAVAPPPQMPDSLRAGNLDGYCVGEPWNSVAVAARAGWIAELGSEISPRHPEKVLMVRRDFAENRSAEHQALIAALLESCAYCHAPENHSHVVSVLASPGCLHRAEDRLRPSYSGVLDAGQDRTLEAHPYLIFSGGHANDPTASKGAWVLGELRACGLIPGPVPDSAALIASTFRHDLFETAVRAAQNSPAAPSAFNSEQNEKSPNETLACC